MEQPLISHLSWRFINSRLKINWNFIHLIILFSRSLSLHYSWINIVAFIWIVCDYNEYCTRLLWFNAHLLMTTFQQHSCSSFRLVCAVLCMHNCIHVKSVACFLGQLIARLQGVRKKSHKYTGSTEQVRTEMKQKHTESRAHTHTCTRTHTWDCLLTHCLIQSWLRLSLPPLSLCLSRSVCLSMRENAFLHAT